MYVCMQIYWCKDTLFVDYLHDDVCLVLSAACYTNTLYSSADDQMLMV